MTTAVPLDRFVGPAIHSHAGGGVAIHESAFLANSIVPVHVHDDPVISLVLHGEATEEVGGRTRDFAAQDVLFTPAYALHGYRFRSPGRWFNMQLSGAWLARVADGGPPLPEAAQIVRSHTAAAWAARVRVDGARTRPRWLRRVEDAIETSVGSPPTNEELAALAGVHPTHLLRTFRRHHGTTIANYVRERRIQWARTQVASAKRPLAAIALDAGFADQSHFTRVFRRAFGETPGEYARSLRGR